MGCQLFGPYDPANDPPDTLQRWIASCPSAGGNYPKACLNADGTYVLYCCSDPGDYPCKPQPNSVAVCLPAEAALELFEKGEVQLFEGLGSIRYDGPRGGRDGY